MKKLSVCPQCKGWYSIDEHDDAVPCPKCNVLLHRVESINYDDFKKMDQQTKDNVKAEYVANHDLEVIAAPQEEAKESKWIGWLDTTGSLVMLSIIIAGMVGGGMLLAGEAYLLGLCIILLSFVVGFCAASGIKTFVQVARDIHDIRDKVCKQDK